MKQPQICQTSQEGIVRIGTAMAVPAVLYDFVLDPAELLAESGLDLKLFDDADISRSQQNSDSPNRQRKLNLVSRSPVDVGK